ncbi:hypothetical protein JYU34_013589, partial [Plutella xylostella]
LSRGDTHGDHETKHDVYESPSLAHPAFHLDKLNFKYNANKTAPSHTGIHANDAPAGTAQKLVE